jgi:phosphoserine phosphatase
VIDRTVSGSVFVARHGETDWNREGRYQGRRESSLTDVGRAQARALSDALRSAAIERVIASPLARCVETARPICESHGLQLEIDDRLIEIAHGDWEGRLRTQIEAEDPLLWQQWRLHPERVRFRGGESLDDVLARWRTFMDDVCGDIATVVVTHDVVVRLAILDASGRGAAKLWEPRVLNGGFAIFETDPWQLSAECVSSHLQGVEVDPASQAL